MAREPDSEQMLRLVLTPECLALPVLWETNHAGLGTLASGEFWVSSAHLGPSLQNLVAKGAGCGVCSFVLPRMTAVCRRKSEPHDPETALRLQGEKRGPGSPGTHG